MQDQDTTGFDHEAAFAERRASDAQLLRNTARSLPVSAGKMSSSQKQSITAWAVERIARTTDATEARNLAVGAARKGAYHADLREALSECAQAIEAQA